MESSDLLWATSGHSKPKRTDTARGAKRKRDTNEPGNKSLQVTVWSEQQRRCWGDGNGHDGRGGSSRDDEEEIEEEGEETLFRPGRWT